MTFTYYEQYHLHDYVDRKGTSYTKAEMDKTLAALKIEIINLIPSNDPVDPEIEKMVNQRMKGRKSLTYVKIPKPFQIESEESE